MNNDRKKNDSKLTLTLKNSISKSSGDAPSSFIVEVVQTRRRTRVQKIGSSQKTSQKLTDKEIQMRNSVVETLKKEVQDNSIVEKSFEPKVKEVSSIADSVAENVSQGKPSYDGSESQKPKVKIEKKQQDTAQQVENKPSRPVVFKAKEYRDKKQTKQTPQRKNSNNFVKSQDTQNKSKPIKYKMIEEKQEPAQQVKQNTPYSMKKNKMRSVENKDSKNNIRYTDKYNRNSTKFSHDMLNRLMDDDNEERTRSIASLNRARQKLKNNSEKNVKAKIVRDVEIPDLITVGELANRMAVKSAEVVKYLMSIGTMATINQSIDGDTAEVICSEFGHRPKRKPDTDIEDDINNYADNADDLVSRAPVVAVMGHVDHGKTTLLDALRQTTIAQKEAGGITQHVASYQIKTSDGRCITFIDTPGHAAFSNMRKRGAVITDIIVLVVAADDGIKEQTVEVIQQAKSQNVPIIVAINKIDKPNINIDRVKSELMAHEVILEDFGGDVLSVEISAMKKINLDGLVSSILLQADIMELKANPKRSAVGTVLEARIDKGKGVIASVIIQQGTLKKGDYFVSGNVYGKVRTIYNDLGKIIPNAVPSTPIELIGFNSVAEPGDMLIVVESEQKAKEIVEKRMAKSRIKSNNIANENLEKMFSASDKETKKLNVFVKADVYGSLEAVVSILEEIKHPEIQIQVVGKSVGIVSESDVEYAKTSNAIIVAFNVNVSAVAKDVAKIHNIKIIRHNVIYHVTEEIKSIMGTMLSPIIEENYIGTADVRKVFKISRLGNIAGCYVTDGVIKRNESKIKVIRNGKCLYEGKIKSMRHEKDEIKESRQGHECGIFAEDYNDFEEGDRIECYEIISKARTVA